MPEGPLFPVSVCLLSFSLVVSIGVRDTLQLVPRWSRAPAVGFVNLGQEAQWRVDVAGKQLKPRTVSCCGLARPHLGDGAASMC